MSASMNQRARPSVFGTAAQAWRSAWLAVLRMPLLMLVSTLVLLAFHVCEQALEGVVGGSRNPYQAALFTLMGLVPIFLLAPVAIAVHRFVLLSERTRLWPGVPAQVVLYFTGWLVVSSLADSLVVLFKQLPYRGITFVGDTMQIALLVLYIRLTLMLPAIAAQSTQLSPSFSWRRTRHRFWRTMAVLFVVEAPLMAPFVLAVILVWHGHVTDHLQSMMVTLGAPLDVAFAVLGAATLSSLFRRYDVAEEPSDLIPAAT